MFPVIDLGPLAIQAPGLILLLSLWLGTWLTGKFAAAIGTNGDAIENSVLFGLIAGILGARIGFMAQNPSVFLSNPLSLISLTPSMLNTGFGLLVGGLTAYILAQKKHLPLWPTLDTLSPLVILMFVGVHLANFANGNAFGLPASLPWAIDLWNAMRHPVQLYAVILGALLTLWTLFHTKGFNTTGFMRSGMMIGLTMAGLGGITVFTRAFVAEKLLLGRFDLVQLIGFLPVSGSLALIYLQKFRNQRIPVLISMGSNMDPKAHLSQALGFINSDFDLRRSSNIYRSADVKDSANAKTFLNQVIEIETTLSFPDLQSRLKSYEKKLGREPGNKKDVPLDLDILTFNKDVFTYQEKHIPDPNMLKYNYILLPLAEIAPEFRHPGTGESIQTIMVRVDNTQIVKTEEVTDGFTR